MWDCFLWDESDDVCKFWVKINGINFFIGIRCDEFWKFLVNGLLFIFNWVIWKEWEVKVIEIYYKVEVKFN